MRSCQGKGFTLIELLIAMAIASVVMSAVSMVYMSQIKTMSMQKYTARVQQNVNAAMYIMTRDLRNACYDPNRSGAAGFLVPQNSGSIGNPQNFQQEVQAMANNRMGLRFTSFSFVAEDDNVDNNWDGNTDEPGELSTITYYVADLDNDGVNFLYREVDYNNPAHLTGRESILAENVDAIDFVFLVDAVSNNGIDDNGDGNIDEPGERDVPTIPNNGIDDNGDGNIDEPGELLAVTAQEIKTTLPTIPNVCSVIITIVVRTTRQDPEYVDRNIYRNTENEVILAQPNDHFRRSSLQSRVSLRNQP